MRFDEAYINDWAKILKDFGFDVDCSGECCKKPEANVGKSESTIVNEETFTTITTDLPGYKKDGIKITVTPKVLTAVVEGVRGKKTYTYKLTETADIQKISSKFEDGVLTITVPKKTEALPVEIKVD
jgi:HSP20 family molecular chaperone IbpA